MSNKGPIILVDDDKEDWEIMKEVLQQESISNELICFINGKDALPYLITTTQHPFIILSDINMPLMNGIELRKRINQNDMLRKKSIPFVFLSTLPNISAIEEAYEMNVQGFFEKGDNMHDIGVLIKEIYNYWQRCRHPNNDKMDD